MKEKGFINRFFQNARRPEGLLGRLILFGMNKGHNGLLQWGMSCLTWKPDWDVLDIGCGGGAILAQILKRCPDGKAFGIDFSPVSVAYSKKKNKKLLGTRCFVEQGSADKLPYENRKFNAVTAFETIYFWGDLRRSFSGVARVLKKDGYFLICCEMSDPTNEKWSNRINGMVVHSEDKLVAILTETGFTNIAVNRQRNEHLCIVAQKAE